MLQSLLVLLLSTQLLFGTTNNNILSVNIEDKNTQWVITIEDEKGSYVYYHKKPLDKNGDVIQEEVDKIILKVKKSYLLESKKD